MESKEVREMYKCVAVMETGEKKILYGAKGWIIDWLTNTNCTAFHFEKIKSCDIRQGGHLSENR